MEEEINYNINFRICEISQEKTRKLSLVYFLNIMFCFILYILFLCLNAGFVLLLCILSHLLTFLLYPLLHRKTQFSISGNAKFSCIPVSFFLGILNELLHQLQLLHFSGLNDYYCLHTLFKVQRRY